ncbi:MAG TPA: lamin tail domain-containing protein, partial [Polyangia bacterium]|nr:lamin tail domain-containing protein [Polyangia bacterium]
AARDRALTTRDGNRELDRGVAGASAGGRTGKDAGADTSNRVCGVKINEVQTSGSTALDEFVELYNTCPDEPLNLAGYSLVYRAASGTTEFVRVSFTGGGFAPGKPYFVCANSGYAGPADARYTDGLADAGGGLALRGPDGDIVDSVGWGTATNAFVEGEPAPAPQAGQSIARVPDGHDTNDNSADFTIKSPPITPGGAN